MKRIWLGMAAALVIVGCESVVEPETTQFGSELSSDAAGTAAPGVVAQRVDRMFLVSNFVAPLSGVEEVPPVDTRARGTAFFQLNKAGDELRYRLIVANITDVLMAHVHMAPAGQNGGVVAWLYPAGPPPQLIEGRSDGVLSEGVITSADLVGALEGQDLSALVEAIRARNTYVNVHTSTVPSGEIRGQIDVGNNFPG